MIKPIISVIVPVYNAQFFLEQCIESVLNQTFNDFELILINDGSKDDSDKICNKYLEIDNRIKVIHKENGGVSSSRNKGIQIASGDWIIFLDADDYWSDNNALAKLYQAAINYNADIIRGEYHEVSTSGEIISTITNKSIKEQYSNKILTPQLFHDKIILGEYFLVLCLINSKFKKLLTFDESQIYLEDMKVFINLLSNDLRCVYIENVFYSYRKHTNAVTAITNPMKVIDSFRMCGFILDKIKNENNNYLNQSFGLLALSMYYKSVFYLSAKDYDSLRIEIINSIKSLNLNNRLKFIRHYKGKNFMEYIILKVNIITGCYIFKIRGFILDIVKYFTKHG